MLLEIPAPHATLDIPLEDGARIRVRRHGNPDGVRLFLSHGITQEKFNRRSSAIRFLERHVFPNAELDDIGHTVDTLERARFEILDVEGLRRHYARTCRQWAERLIAKMRGEFESLRRKAVHGKHRPRFYCEAWPNPRISSPPWVAELVQIVGGEMVVPAGEKITDEQVASACPDVIVLAWAATGAKAEPKKAYEVAAWSEVPAIRNRRVHVISDELLNTPGPPLIEGARQLLQILHGDIRARSRT